MESNKTSYLSYFRSLGLELFIDGGQLRCTGQVDLVEARRAEIAAKANEIASELSEERLVENLAIVPISRDGGLQMSYDQERLWFVDQLLSSNYPCNLSRAFHFVGRLDTEPLQQSLQEIVRRHEVLRSRFVTIEGQPRQVACSTIDVENPVTDLLDLPESQRMNKARSLISDEARKPFDLEQGSMLRTRLFRLKPDEHILLLVTHEIVADNMSMDLLVKKLAFLYRAFSRGDLLQLTELPVQYADFAHWERRRHAGKLFDSQLVYWKNQLADIPPMLELPTDRLHPVTQSYQGYTECFDINDDVTQKLHLFNDESHSDHSIVLLAVFLTLLYRYTGSRDLIVGSTVLNRNRRETRSLIGPLSSIQLLRVDMSGDPTFRTLVDQIHTTINDSHAQSDIKFSQLVEVLLPEQSTSYHPLCQVMFNYRNPQAENPEFPELIVNELKHESISTKFDLDILIKETKQGLCGELVYSCDLFDQDTIHRMIGHYKVLLDAAMQHPDEPLSKLRMLTEPEEHQLLVTWNDTVVDYPADKCMHQLFERQAGINPDHVAVVAQDNQLTYYELNCRANQLAHYLVSLGIGPGMLVGICVERSLELIISVLGVLKAGGAYVPMDPDYPADRIAFITKDAGIAVLLTQKRLANELPGTDALMIRLDRDWPTISQQSQENPKVAAAPHNLAYMIYTSGTTGQPKGVLTSHRALVNYINWARLYYVGERSLAFALHTSIAVDLTVTSIYVPLVSGGQIVIYPDKDDDDLPIMRVFEDDNVDVVKLTPAHLALITSMGGTTQRIRYLILGGEDLKTDLARSAHNILPSDAVLYNEYGPTEATVGCMIYRFDPTEEHRASVPIGTPIANTKIYVLNEALQPSPIGVTGELYIGGAGLANGYLNRDEMTTARFIQNPFNSDSRSRLYKTGDLGRYLPKGNIDLLGRTDRQVKIRGYRVELEEVESIIVQQHTVKEAAVVAVEDHTGSKQLVAYVTLKRRAEHFIPELQRFLRSELPSYMVPNHIIPLDSLPLSASGKVNHKALPALERIRADQKEHLVSKIADTAYVPPRNRLEFQLSEIWESVFGVTFAGIHDNFFDLGGHSLMALRIVTDIEKLIGTKIPVTVVFQSPTIGQLATTLRNKDWSQAWPSLVPIQSGDSMPPVFLTHFEDGAIFHAHFRLARSLGPDQTVYGLQALGLDGQQKPQTRLQDMADYYIQEIRKICPDGPYHLIAVCHGALVAFEMAQQLKASDQDIGLLALVAPAPPTLETTYYKTMAYRNPIKGVPLEMHQLIDAQFGSRRNYIPQAYPGRVTYFHASEEPAQPIQSNWEKLVKGELETHEFPGGHDNIFNDDILAILGGMLRNSIDKFNAEHSNDSQYKIGKNKIADDRRNSLH